MENCKTWTDPRDLSKMRRYIEVNGKLTPLSWSDYCKLLETDRSSKDRPVSSEIQLDRESDICLT